MKRLFASLNIAQTRHFFFHNKYTHFLGLVQTFLKELLRFFPWFGKKSYQPPNFPNFPTQKANHCEISPTERLFWSNGLVIPLLEKTSLERKERGKNGTSAPTATATERQRGG